MYTGVFKTYIFYFEYYVGDQWMWMGSDRFSLLTDLIA